MSKIIVVVGPTASGKSTYAVDLARRLGGEVISADSRQVYRGLDIGSGKITKREMRGVPHHMLDVVDPKKTFTAHDYVRLAKPILDDILARGKTAIICGGTGFYIDALLGRISLPDAPRNEKLRTRLAKKSAPELYRLLARKDPRRAASIDRHNPVRLIRALEIAATLGHVPPSTQATARHITDYVEWIGIERTQDELRSRIHARLLARMRSGMLAEAKRLHARGLSYRRMEELGLEYRYLARLLRGTVTKAQFLQELEAEILRYAKRQRTYWRRHKLIRWLELTNR